MTRKETAWFLRERSRAMAIVHLTRRDDLRIGEPTSVEGPKLAFLVRIVKEASRPSIRQFGVALSGSMRASTIENLSKTLRSEVEAFAEFGEYPYPVCLFHFTMADNEGYYTWIAEPAVTEGQPRLRTETEAEWQTLDRPALDTIVKRVDAWYDAFYASINAASPA